MPAHPLCRFAGCGHHANTLKGWCRTYAATVVSEIDRTSSANGAVPPLEILNASVASRRSLPTRPENLHLPPHGFDSIESALEALRRGGMVVVLDDEDRENEGDLIMAADKVSSCSPYIMPVYVRATGQQAMIDPILSNTLPPQPESSAIDWALCICNPDRGLQVQVSLTAMLHKGCTFMSAIAQHVIHTIPSRTKSQTSCLQLVWFR